MTDAEKFDRRYHETTRAVGTQQWVADEWATWALPTHSEAGDAIKLRTSTKNFRGFQYPDGHGKLKHYGHIEAIRTRSGLILGDTSCYARGWAKCNKPKDSDGYFDVTKLKKKIQTEDFDVYDIDRYDSDSGEVRFSNGAVYSIEGWKWVKEPIQKQSVTI